MIKNFFKALTDKAKSEESKKEIHQTEQEEMKEETHELEQVEQDKQEVIDSKTDDNEDI